VAELPRSRYATGSAISSTFRQLGAVLGISGLIAVLGTPGADGALAAFHRVWALVALTGTLAAAIAVALGRVRARQVDEPPGTATAPPPPPGATIPPAPPAPPSGATTPPAGATPSPATIPAAAPPLPPAAGGGGTP
jgi:hypothetical protein